jgi:hypothetical protein
MIGRGGRALKRGVKVPLQESRGAVFSGDGFDRVGDSLDIVRINEYYVYAISPIRVTLVITSVHYLNYIQIGSSWQLRNYSLHISPLIYSAGRVSTLYLTVIRQRHTPTLNAHQHVIISLQSPTLPFEVPHQMESGLGHFSNLRLLPV